MVKLSIKEYTPKEKAVWDDFVLNHSINGTFLQTRQFLEYHKDRFDDTSLIIHKGTDTMVAVVPACIIIKETRKKFSSHCGSTFGGIVLGTIFNNIEHVEAIFEVLENYFIAQKYDEIEIKCTSSIFASGDTHLLSYFLFQKGYCAYDELSCLIDFKQYQEDVISNFTARKRRDYRYSLKYNMKFKKLDSTDAIEEFYGVLCDNLKKYNTAPVHTLYELIELKEKRLTNVIEFYGVYYTNIMIAGSMVFKFGHNVFHTQYLAANQQYLKLYPMNFLDTNLIQVAKEEGFQYFSFGISTEEHGKVLNKHLAQFKEGFGTQYGINKTYIKKYR